MSVSTFGSFTTARLGLYASQKALEVAGNNIANINTRGYSRQALQQSSLHVGGADRYQSSFSARVGSGVLCTGVSQLRDPYLDIRFRNEQSSVGAMDAKLGGLEELASILDEVGKGGGDGVIEKQFTDLINQLQNMVTQGAGKDEFDALVRSSASTLVTLFNTYASKLDTILENQTIGFTQDITAVNTILENIRDLNVSIRRSEIHGSDALELRDQRNMLIDDLSQYMKIDVTYEKEDIGAGTFVDKLVIKLAGNGQGNTSERSTLVDGIFATKLSITQVPDPDFDLSLGALRNKQGTILAGSVPTNLGDNDLYGALQSTREMLTEKGEYADPGSPDPNATIKRGIPYYQKMLDALANKFAGVLNDANTLDYCIDGDPAKGVKPEYADYFNTPGDHASGFKPEYEKYKGGNLFSNGGNGNDGSGITAGNISISDSWAKGAVRMLQSKAPNFTSTDNSNLTNILYLMTANQEYKPDDTVAGAGSTTFFKGNFQKMLTNITATLANDIKTTSSMLENYSSAADELFVDRHSVAGVDLNDEMMGLMQYQKSYAAAARMMTTLDEVLDKLINGTGRAGL